AEPPEEGRGTGGDRQEAQNLGAISRGSEPIRASARPRRAGSGTWVATGGPASRVKVWSSTLNWSTNRRRIHAICRLAVGVGATARLAVREGRVAAAHRPAFASPAVGRRAHPGLEAQGRGAPDPGKALSAGRSDRAGGVRAGDAGRVGTERGRGRAGPEGTAGGHRAGHQGE